MADFRQSSLEYSSRNFCANFSISCVPSSTMKQRDAWTWNASQAPFSDLLNWSFNLERSRVHSSFTPSYYTRSPLVYSALSLDHLEAFLHPASREHSKSRTLETLFLDMAASWIALTVNSLWQLLLMSIFQVSFVQRHHKSFYLR